MDNFVADQESLLFSVLFFSHDNRRLYVFRVLNMLGLLPKIEVTESNRIDTSKITTINGGCHVFVRNRKDNNGRWRKAETFRHCTCEQGKRNYRLPGMVIILRFNDAIGCGSRIFFNRGGIWNQEMFILQFCGFISIKVLHT